MTIFPYKMAKVFCHDEEISVPEWASCQEKDLSFSLCAKIWSVCGEFLGINFPLNDGTFVTSAFDGQIVCFAIDFALLTRWLVIDDSIQNVYYCVNRVSSNDIFRLSFYPTQMSYT